MAERWSGVMWREQMSKLVFGGGVEVAERWSGVMCGESQCLYWYLYCSVCSYIKNFAKIKLAGIKI